MTGETLDHYRIETKIGEGGMGVVYRAVDLRLERAVALKLLPAEAVANPERKRRFVQEAKAASALNHPNIIHIYDIGNAGGVDFIAMEYVEGKTLDRLIGRKGLSVGEALKYAIQIADALARAHAAGIVHRDLKPANVMVTGEGLAKVLDFGLAKLTERDAEIRELEATMSISAATAGSGRTEEGVILGTVAYMSPEQAQGKKVDARSDIFSFGSMLCEMVTGRRPFDGENNMSTLAAILNQEPRLSAESMVAAPRELQKIVARCLRKDPARRVQTMADLKVALEDLRDAGPEIEPPPPRAPAARRGLTIVAAAALVAAGAGVAWWLTRPGPAGGVTVLNRVTADEGLTTDPAISPNGSLLAYASDRGAEANLDIWVQPVPSGEPIRITQHEADDREPAFSPDGSKIAFRSERDGGAIYVVPALGGTQRLLVKDGRRPRFSPDGKWIAYYTGGRGSNPKIHIIPESGGEPKPVAADFAVALTPVWSPDSKHLLFGGTRKENDPGDWFLASIDEAKVVQLRLRDVFRGSGLTVPGCVPEAWIASDRVFCSASLGDGVHIWELGVSAKSGRITAAPRQITLGTSADSKAALAVGPADVRLFFSAVSEKVNIWSLPIDARQARTTGEMRQLTHGAAVDMWPSISADGKKVAFLSNRSSNWDVWTRNLETGAETALTVTPSDEGGPEISADGTKVAYSAGPPNAGLFYDKQTIYVASAGGGVPQKICPDCAAAIWDWTKDGKQLLVWAGSAVTSVAKLAVVDAAGGRKTEILQHPQFPVYHARFSPDGRWIVFMVWKGADKAEKWIAPFRGHVPVEQRDWIQITEGDALEEEICWSPEGDVLYFVSERDGFRCLYARRLDPATKHPLGPSWALQHFHRARRSIIDTSKSWAKISVARDKLVFAMHEITGNIWVAKLPK